MKRFLKLVTLTLVLAILPMAAFADDDFGSAAVSDGQTYSIEQMLTYAMQDEYMAQAEYAALMQAFGVTNPYANILKAEQTHQEELLPLFAAYGIAVPENNAAANVVLPATLQEAYEIGVQAEINNIDMYQAFLAQSDVPADVHAVFTELINASQSHLQAFTRNAEKTGTGLGYGQTRTDASAQTFGGRMAAENTASTQTYGNRMAAMNVPATQTYGNRAADQTAVNGRGGWQAASIPTRGMGQRNVTTGTRVMDTDNCPMYDDVTVQQNVGGRWN